MRISTKGDYGVRALIELAHHYGEGPMQSAEIAARQRIPEPYLDQLLTTLRRPASSAASAARRAGTR